MAEDQWGAGDPAAWRDHGSIFLGKERLPLIYGEHPHSRSDNRHYAVMNGKPMEFDGHRIQIGVVIETHNYLKESELSGDEIRKGGSGKILADGEVVLEFFTRDAQYACLKAHQLIAELSDHPSGWLNKSDRDALIGRKVFFRGHPAVIERLIVEQGCVTLKTADGKPFPPPPWRDADDDDGEDTVKDEVLSPSIWWFRQ